MRDHFFNCIERNKIEPFPISKERRRAKDTSKVVQVQVHCYCCCAEYAYYAGEKMFFCDGVCGEWFHIKCIDVDESIIQKKWHCKNCLMVEEFI